jgi:hypothetical protein
MQTAVAPKSASHELSQGSVQKPLAGPPAMSESLSAVTQMRSPSQSASSLHSSPSPVAMGTLPVPPAEVPVMVLVLVPALEPPDPPEPLVPPDPPEADPAVPPLEPVSSSASGSGAVSLPQAKPKQINRPAAPKPAALLEHRAFLNLRLSLTPVCPIYRLSESRVKLKRPSSRTRGADR